MQCVDLFHFKVEQPLMSCMEMCIIAICERMTVLTLRVAAMTAQPHCILLHLHSFLSINHYYILATVITQTQFNNTLAPPIPLLSLYVPTNHLSSISTNLHCSSYPLLRIYVYLNIAYHTISDHIVSYPITAGRGSTCGIQSSALKQLRAILEKDTHITATGAYYACHCD